MTHTPRTTHERNGEGGQKPANTVPLEELYTPSAFLIPIYAYVKLYHIHHLSGAKGIGLSYDWSRTKK
jgi:hypothetical protein